MIGVTERAPGPGGRDTKKMRAGGSRGLTIPDGWIDRPGPVLLVEGPSDTLAATAAGLAAVGRPSNTGGVGHLAGLLAGMSADREILVVGENDRKDNGSWPGRDGADRTAAALAAELGRPVMVGMPPAGGRTSASGSPAGRRAGPDGRTSARNCSPTLRRPRNHRRRSFGRRSP